MKEICDSYDSKLQLIKDGGKLRWLPWIGSNYENLTSGERVLIVGESHYYNKGDPNYASKEELDSDPLYSRRICSEAFAGRDWATATPRNLNNLIYNSDRREQFWAHFCYFNLVQKSMHRTENGFTRPNWDDFGKGWEAFLELVRVIRPDYVLVIGVEASHQFDRIMKEQNQNFVPVSRHEKVGVASARTASVLLDSGPIEIHFIKHCGSYFSVDRWQDYLQRNARSLMECFAKFAGRAVPEVVPNCAHIIGMVQRSIDPDSVAESELELDFLRLAYTIRDIRESESAQGFFAVFNKELEKEVKAWEEKYGTGDAVEIALLSEEQLGSSPQQRLRNMIEQRYSKIDFSCEKPMKIDWAYYGKVLEE